MNQSYRQIILDEMLNSIGRINARKIKFMKVYIKDLIYKVTDYLPTDTSITERLFCIKENIKSKPTCSSCGEKQSWKKYVGYNNSCGSPSCVLKIRIRDNGQIGAVGNADKLKEKFIASFRETSILEDKEIIKRTNILLNNHNQKGFNWFMYNNELEVLANILLKTEKFIPIEDNDILKSIGLRIAIVKANYKLPLCDICNKPHLRFNSHEKFKNICGDKYCAIAQSNISRWKNCADSIEDDCLQLGFVLQNKDDFLTDGTGVLGILECSKGHLFNRYLYGGRRNNFRCTVCSPRGSIPENELSDFIVSLGFDIKNNDRSLLGFELDIYVESASLAIEMDGLYWHSHDTMEKVLPKRNNHVDKTNICEDNGIQLLHVTDYEWNFQRNIVQSRIRNILDLNGTIGARKCTIKEVSTKDSRMFLDDNHIQGFVGAKVKLGLYYEDRLVSIMTFGKSRHNKSVEYELLRFCSILNYSIVGGASKLFKHFIRNYNPESIISYADRRWSQGNLYNNLGFDLSHISRPNYFYYGNGNPKLQSRLGFQKHKLKDKLEIFDPNNTEMENMLNNGYRVFYDCGNLVFVWTKENG